MKKIYVCFAVAVIAFSVTKVSNPNGTSVLIDANVDALAQVESHFCYNGGPGANQCSIEAGITIVGNGVSANCSVSCNSGYYACCGIRCICVKE